MADRKFLIAQIDGLLKECSTQISNLVDDQKMNEHDARVAFYKHMNNILNSTTLSLILAHKYLGSFNLKELHKEYNLHQDYMIMRQKPGTLTR